MDRKKNFLINLLCIAALAAIAWCFWKYVLHWILPFLIAYVVAMLLNPAITWCQRTLRFQRGFSAAVFTILAVSGVSILLFALASTLLNEAYAFLQQAPLWLSFVQTHLQPLTSWFDRFCAKCPPELQDFLTSTLEGLSAQASSLLGDLSQSLLSYGTALVGKFPRYALFLITTILAIFYTSNHYPAIRAFLKKQLSSRSLQLVKKVKPQLFSTLLKWLKSELTLISVTFVILLGGFSLLRVRYAFLMALLTALIDALPIFGTGTILLPWALFCFLGDDILLGIGLVALYLIAQLTHSLLEPRLLAGQVGLPAIAALFAMYVGFCILGVSGMIGFPFLLIFIKQLHDAGYLRLWK